MSSVVENELLGWAANEAEQIASGLGDGSMSQEDACRYLRNVARKIAAESESACERLTKPIEGNHQAAFAPASSQSRRISSVGDSAPSMQSLVRVQPGAPRTRRDLRSIQRRAPRRCWQMKILDLEMGTLRTSKKRLTKLEAAMVLEEWPAKRLNALVFFVPDWAECSVSMQNESLASA